MWGDVDETKMERQTAEPMSGLRARAQGEVTTSHTTATMASTSSSSGSTLGASIGSMPPTSTSPTAIDDTMVATLAKSNLVDALRMELRGIQLSTGGLKLHFGA